MTTYLLFIYYSLEVYNSACQQKCKGCFSDKKCVKIPLEEIQLVRQRSYWRRSGENVQRCVCFVNIQSSLHENVVGACMGNAAYIIFIMWNSISGLAAWYHFRFNISCGVAVKVRSHQEKFDVYVYREGGKKNLVGRANFQGPHHFLGPLYF